MLAFCRLRTLVRRNADVRAVAAAVALSLALSGPAFADGGAGGSGSAGTGGGGGTNSSTGAGGVAGDSSQADTGTASGGGGGGGGAGITGGAGGEGAASGTSGAGGAGGASPGAAGDPGSNGGTSGAGGGGGGAHGAVSSTLTSGPISGGDGGIGGSSTGGGGGGGAGGYGAVITGSSLSGTISGSISGGDGGNGGSGSPGGAGGSGGIGLQFTGTGHQVTIDGSITGGKGGNTPNSGNATGPGGSGATGLDLGAGSAATISGTVVGGNGGTGLTIGSAGTGIVGQNADLIITSTGTVSGGLNASSVRASAIEFTGGTNSLTIESGATINGAIAGAGSNSLKLDGTTTGSFDLSQVSGFSDLGKTGSGSWAVTGSLAADSTTVDSGTLSVNGSIGHAGATIDVDGGTLGGTGTLIGTTTVNSGGTLAPGNSIGTLDVSGDVTFATGSQFRAEIDSTGASDLLNVTGTVVINGGTAFALAPAGHYVTGAEYTIITASGGVTGQFAALDTSLAFVDLEIDYDVNEVLLRILSSGVQFDDVAITGNQRSFARALQKLSAGNPVYDAVMSQTASGARQAFDALSGEVYASTAGVLIDQSHLVRGSILDRMLQASYAGTSNGPNALGAGGPVAMAVPTETLPEGRMALGAGSSDADASSAPSPARNDGLVFWTQGYGSWAQYDGGGNAASLDRSLGGFISGVDTKVDNNWRAGLATGYTRSDLSVSSRLSSADVDSYLLAAYAGGRVGEFAVRSGATWSWNDVEATRNIVFPGFSSRETASYDSNVGQVFAELARPFVHGKTAIEPFGGLAWVHLDTDGFKESSGVAALAIEGSDDVVGYSTLGVRAASTISINGLTVTPHVSLAWQHAFGDTAPDIALALVSGGTSFGIAGVPLAENSALIEAGLDLRLSADATLGISYSGQLASEVEDHGVSGRLNWRF